MPLYAFDVKGMAAVVESEGIAEWVDEWLLVAVVALRVQRVVAAGEDACTPGQSKPLGLALDDLDLVHESLADQAPSVVETEPKADFTT